MNGFVRRAARYEIPVALSEKPTTAKLFVANRTGVAVRGGSVVIFLRLLLVRIRTQLKLNSIKRMVLNRLTYQLLAIRFFIPLLEI